MERKTDSLYIIRFLAALLIICYHYTPLTLIPSLNWIIKNGNEAVNLFFFISGFVLLVSNAGYLKSPGNEIDTRYFYVKRLARIYPLYALAILILAFFHYLIINIDTASVKYRLPFELLGVQRWIYAGSFNYPGWSISCEFFFYLLFPFLIQLLKRYPKFFTVFVLIYWVVSVWATAGLYALTKQSLPVVPARLVSTLFMHPVLLIGMFMCGMLTGHWYIQNKFALLKRAPFNVMGVIFTCILIMLLKYYLPPGSALLKGGIFAPVYFLLIYTVTNLDKRLSSFLGNRLFRFLGDISYAMYILQYPIYCFYTHFVQKVTGYQSLFCFIMAEILISVIIHVLVEKPLRTAIINYYLEKRGQKAGSVKAV
nr:acyltransferase [uncultured Mucilaginibacter sp.]